MTTTIEPTTKQTNWWVPVIKGTLLFIFGIWIFRTPVESLMNLTTVFGVIIILGGLLEVGLAFNRRKHSKNWVWDVTSGMLDILLGAFMVANPSIIFVIITALVSLWLLIRGIMLIRISQMSKKADNPRYIYSLVFGILMIVLAVVFVWHPQILGITLAFWVALAFISLGLFRIIIGLRLRKS